MLSSLAIFAYSSLILPTLSAPTSSQNGLVVQTSSGEIHGFINQTAPDVLQFLGVPYAKAPVGNLRFAAPQTATKASSAIQATAFPPSCMQVVTNRSSIYNHAVPEFAINGGQSEDCLYLSIWAPANPTSESLPVFVYIPGGGYVSGGENSLYKIPDQWVQKTQSHIMVVMNYRLNVFGYPNAKAITTDKNPGLLDQRKAVEWVYQNIASFNGDPERLTLWGQSAGAASVDNYAYAYPTDPIVKGLILDSGSSFLLRSTDSSQTNFTALAGMVGCKNLKPTAELKCMRKVSATAIANALSDYSNSGATPALSFVPVPDNVTAFANPEDRALKGLGTKLPAIIGSNTNEGAGFLPFSEAGPGAAALFSATQNIIACPVAQEVRTRGEAGLTTYRYQYAGNFTNISPVPWMGAFHSSELPLLFDTHFQYRGNSTPFEYEMADTMQALWLSFANNSAKAPSVGDLTWPEYEAGKDSMLLFAKGDVATQLASGEVIDGSCTL
ncbi:hypothetical protein DSL72_006053 [Monilinia vaccinii-corymbosi]|uniref:Carboxylesterase type B domain-containing protein n=1 Tax=Monilinia vaccinii-corymbosi TaxID=61207 RepID=A0A8A3PHE6_9HELO|nr:hypothetical protein DSL72_006053 [Monilinia vaccinii-corymbosi]